MSKISALHVLEQASQPCSSWQRAAECDLQKSFNSKLVLNPCGMTKVLFHYFFIFHLHLKWRICCDIKQNQSCSKEVFDISYIRSKLPIFSNLFFFTHPKNHWQLKGWGGLAKDEIAKQLKKLAEAYSARGDRWRSWQLAKAWIERLNQKPSLLCFQPLIFRGVTQIVGSQISI